MMSRCSLRFFQVVVISDPHIKVDPEWWLYCEARDGEHFVKNRDGGVFQGSCWSGKVYLKFRPR